MTDFELVSFLGLQDLRPDHALRLVARIQPKRRAVYDAMKDVMLWAEGKGLKPKGIIVCH